MLIYCRNFHGAKVYLSSLSDGECFGEFSFFTQEPRAATVEALDEVLLFEIKPSFFDEIPERFPKLTETLLAFYKGTGRDHPSRKKRSLRGPRRDRAVLGASTASSRSVAQPAKSS